MKTGDRLPTGPFVPAARLGALALLATLVACASPSPPPVPPAPAVPPVNLPLWGRVSWLAERLETARDPAEEARLASDLGRAYLEVDRPERARTFFRRSLYRDAAGELVGANERGIGESYLREGNAPSAEPSLARAVLRSKDGAERDEARLLQAICLERLGRAADAEAVRRGIDSPTSASLALLERSLGPSPAAPPPSPAVAKADSSAPASLRIRPRASWVPRPIGRDVDPMGSPTRITVHHSATAFTDTSEETTAVEIRNIQRIHQGTSGWADIGYHFVVDRAGRVWEARPLTIQGAHAGNRAANKGNIGVCLLGNFEEESIPPAQAEALRAILRDLAARYRIGPESIFTHREIRRDYGLRSTECPGRSLQAFVDRLRRRTGPSGSVVARSD